MSSQVTPAPALQLPQDEPEIELPASNSRNNSVPNGATHSYAALISQEPVVHDMNGNAVNETNPNGHAVRVSLREEKMSQKSQHSDNNNQGATEKPPLPPTRFEMFKLGLKAIIESRQITAIMAIFTVWALFGDDIRLAATGKEADEAFLKLISVIFFCFILELICVSIYKPDYFVLPEFAKLPGESNFQMVKRICTGVGSFYFWLDVIATVSLIFEITWILPTLGSSKAGASSKAGTKAARVVRIVRMVRLVRMVKLYKYATKQDDEVQEEKESHVGAAMSDLTNRRVIVLILAMLIIIPLLTVTSTDYSSAIITKLIHSAAHEFTKNPDEYRELFYAVCNASIAHSKVIGIELNGEMYWSDAPAMEKRRLGEEAVQYIYGSKYPVTITFDNWHNSILSAQYSIGTTIFVIFLLTCACVMLNRDVERLIIKPIERMVELVDRISANPLGVRYEMLGEEDGFVQGMETTILLSTITKIGALMKVGFGEAGANVIARNLRDSTTGKMNLMAGGELITSIFGFCDVRQFTDTTECLQEEVMLFVNRIAHILHGIVAQCSGSANKNIGDAFLLTWKLDERCSEKEISMLADQALFAFCKTLVELVRYEEFICNFSIAATQRLYKRFNDYHVRIGSGLHVGWAIEGAIGSARKIDATYLSPHVNFTEFLESSTKEYGVQLLMSEKFYSILSPAAQKYVRQVDRVRRSHEEEPIGLYTYDSDVTLEFADPNRKRPNPQPVEGNNSMGRGLSSLRMAAMRVVNDNRRASVQQRPGDLAPLTEGADASGQAPLSMLNPRRTSLPAARQQQLAAGGGGEDGKLNPGTGSAGQMRTQFQAPVINVPVYDQSLWDTDVDVVDLRHKVNDVFRAIWKEGMDYYISGGSDWQKARDKFQETMRMSRNKDGPSKFIISILDKHLGSCPPGWQGFRDLEGGGH